MPSVTKGAKTPTRRLQCSQTEFKQSSKWNNVRYKLFLWSTFHAYVTIHSEIGRSSNDLLGHWLKRKLTMKKEREKNKGGGECFLPPQAPSASNERRQMAATFPLIRRGSSEGDSPAYLAPSLTNRLDSGALLIHPVSNCSQSWTSKLNLCTFNRGKLQLCAQCCSNKGA